MAGEEAVAQSLRVLEEILKLMRFLCRWAKDYQEKHPKIKFGEGDLRKLAKTEDMVAIEQSLTDSECEKFSELADKFAISYSIVEHEGENIIFIRKSDLQRAEMCLNRIFKTEALEQAKEKLVNENGISEEQWDIAMQLFDVQELHDLNTEGMTFEDALDHITERDYSKENFYYLFDKENPDKYIKLNSKRELDHKGNEYTKTYYTVYDKDKVIGTYHDGRFEGRQKDYWMNTKQEMKSSGFSDNVVILNEKETLDRFRDTYNKRLNVIEDNMTKRMSELEIKSIMDSLELYTLPLIDGEVNIKEKLEKTLNEIGNIQKEIEQKKLEAFEHIGSKPKETKEEFRERMSIVNGLQDEVKSLEVELAKEYSKKEVLFEDIKNAIGVQMEEEAYLSMVSSLKSKYEQVMKKDDRYINDKEGNFWVETIVVPPEYADEINKVLEKMGVQPEKFEKNNEGKMVSVTTSKNRERYGLIKDKVEAICENRVLDNISEYFDRKMSIEDISAIENKYANKVLYDISKNEKSLAAIKNKIAGRKCFKDKVINIFSSSEPEKYISFKVSEENSYVPEWVGGEDFANYDDIERYIEENDDIVIECVDDEGEIVQNGREEQEEVTPTIIEQEEVLER